MRVFWYKTFSWLPRVLGVLFSVFIGLFAVDVFNQGYPGLRTLIAFLTHLIPAAIIFVSTLIGWRWPNWGAALFAVIGTVYVFYFDGQPWLVYALISGPLFFIAILFAVSSMLNRQKDTGE